MAPPGQFDGKIDAQGEFYLYDRFWERGEELLETFAKALAEEIAEAIVEERRARWSSPITVDLTEARTNPESIGSYTEAGDCILYLPDSTGVATIYLDSPTSHGYRMGVDYEKVRGSFREIFVSNIAQPDCKLYLLVGQGDLRVRSKVARGVTQKVDESNKSVGSGDTYQFLSYNHPGHLDEALIIGSTTSFSVVVTINGEEFLNKTYAQYCNITQTIECISAFEELDEDGNPLSKYVVHIKNLVFKESIAISVTNNGASPIIFHNLFAKYRGG